MRGNVTDSGGFGDTKEAADLNMLSGRSITVTNCFVYGLSTNEPTSGVRSREQH
jgi:hypothetical protein